jgi:Zn-dependent protease
VFGERLALAPLYFVLVLAHEIGHWALVLAFGGVVAAIRIGGLGGECVYEGGWIKPLPRALIAWGGVVAQAVLLVAGLALLPARGGGLLTAFRRALVEANALLIVLNLLPARGLDGGEAWGIFPHLFRALRKRWLRWRLAQLQGRAERLTRDGEEDERPPSGWLN